MISAALALHFALAPAPTPTPDSSSGPSETEEIGVVEKKEADPTVFPDPAKFRRGFFVEGATGPLIPIGPTQRVLNPGFSLTGRTGYEVRRWIAFGLQATGSISRYNDGVLDEELLQQYFYTGEIRFGIPIRRFLIALQGGAGLYQVSSNLLQIADIAPSSTRFGFAWDASAALDFHSLSRHFSGGVLATYYGVPTFSNAGALAIQVYLRYTL